MSLARRVRKGVTYLLSRRTTRRFFLFRPDDDRKMEQLFWYCLAVAAAKHGVVVHAAIQLSNHLHIVATDVDGVLPDFLQDFHRMLACATKAHRGWPGEVLDKNQTSAVEPVTRDTLVKQIAYVIANAPLSGLVRYAHDWPGALTRVDDIGRRVVRVERPDEWFDDENEDWPDEAELDIAMPDALLAEHGSPDAARDAIAAAVRGFERLAHDQARRTGKRFLGADRVVRVPITRRGSKWELFGARNPTFAAGGHVEAARAAVARLRAFRKAYQDALTRWRAGDRDVVWPYGTWWMRVHHAAPCEPPPS